MCGWDANSGIVIKIRSLNEL